MCLCAIAIGVYSAKTASLNVSGTIGFTAHNCDVGVEVNVWGDAVVGETANPEGTPRPASSPKTLTKEIRGATTANESLNLGAIYFSDMTDGDNIADIVVKFSFTNQSKFSILADIERAESTQEGVKITYSDFVTMKEQGKGEESKGVITVTFSKTNANTLTDFAINLNVSFEKYSNEPLLRGYNITNGTLNSYTGTAKDVVIPATYSVTTSNRPIEGSDIAVTAIGANAFKDKNITSVVIPKSVTSIGESAFLNCTALTSITMESATPPTIATTTFSGVPETCAITVPTASTTAYKSATNWSSRGAHIQEVVVGYTVSFRETSSSGESTNCVLRVYLADGKYNDVTVNGSLSSSTVYKNVVEVQLLADTVSRYLYYTMSGKSSYLYHAGSGNPSEKLKLTGDICFDNNYYYQECISADTMVTMANGSYKQLGEIRTGDYVLSYDWETMQLVSRKVIYASCEEENWNNGNWDAVRYFVNTFSDGTVIKQAFAHRFYNREKQAFVYLEQWEIGNHTYSKTGDIPSLVSREVVYETIRYARITLEGSTNYFANGLLTGDRHCPTGITLGNDK